ncbi:hypothetical protein LCGC14_1095630 [marine sediment metagenome]|uniref:DUF4942 domain-containing protein n=1 Tax=marine sediment metagenome TaxID=412755 RepID=A0A0F9QH18_9ZZZZ
MRKTSIFSKNFYPTPPEVVRRMLENLDFQDKTILEPSAGKGNIIDVLRERGGKVLACELNPDLAVIAAKKADRMLSNDFFHVQRAEVSHIDFIIMNPPFDNGELHLLHAWEIAPDGCTIVSLLNKNTIRFIHRSKKRGELENIIKEFGDTEDISSPFEYSERPTGVEVVLVKLIKPSKDEKDEFDGYFDLYDNWEESGTTGILPHNDIVELVNRYVGAVKLWDETMTATDKINSLASPFDCDIRFGAYRYNSSYNRVSRDDFKKELQKAAWQLVFKKFDMKKYMTSSLMEELNKFVEEQIHVPFTIKNVFKMVDLVIQTQGDRMKRVIVEVFDNLTKHYDENRYQLAGWKTNSEYRVNQKFIIHWGNITNEGNNKFGPSYSSSYIIDDLTKAMCHVTGKNFDDYPSWQQWADNYQKINTHYDYIDDSRKRVVYDRVENKRENRVYGIWHDYGFFQLKGFKKGTIHMKFKDEKQWERFNQVACEAKGFRLASKFTSDFRQKPTDITVAA